MSQSLHQKRASKSFPMETDHSTLYSLDGRSRAEQSSWLLNHGKSRKEKQ